MLPLRRSERISRLSRGMSPIWKTSTGFTRRLQRIRAANLGSITEVQIDRTFNVNVRGLIFTVQKALPFMHEGSSIILNASSASIKGIGSLSVYAASKAAVRSLARSWTIDLKDRSIRVNTISPGYTETSIFETLDWTKEQFEEVKAGITKALPLGRWAYSEEIAKAAVFFGF